MKRRVSAYLLLFSFLFTLGLAAFAAAEGEPAINSAAAYEDGLVLVTSNLVQGAEPDSLSVFYVTLAQEAQEITDLPGAAGVNEIPVALPLGGNGAIILSGLKLTPGSTLGIQLKAVYGDGQTTLLSAVAKANVMQGLIPTAPATIAFASKVESLFEGQALDLPMVITPISSDKTFLTYTSSNQKVLTVDAAGVVTGVSKGKATITATGVTEKGKKLKATVTVQVNRAVTQISFGKSEVTLATGKRTTLKAEVSPSSASIKGVTYASSDEGIATVDKNGSVKGISQGVCLITATSQSNPEISATYKVSVVIPVSKMTLDIGIGKVYVGQSMPLIVGYSPDSATIKAAVFKSSAEKYVTVDENGVVTGIAKGKSTITATAADGSGAKVSKSIQVLQQPLEIAFKSPPATMSVGTNKKLTAVVSPSSTSDKTLIWSSSNEAIATVSKNGTVTPLYPGQVTITATAKEFPGIYASCDLTVVQPAQKIELSDTRLNILVLNTAQLSYVITPDYTTNKTVVWASSRPSVASVDQNGLVTAHKRGTATITVTCQDGSKKTAKATVNVIQPLYGMALDKEELRVGVGDSGTLTAILDPEDASNSKVRWHSSNPNVARVSGSSIKGSVTGISWGDAVITAVTDEGEYTDEATVHVGDYNKALEVAALSLLPASGGGYVPFFQLRNASNMEVTHVNFIIQGFDINGGLLYMGNNHAYVFGEYLQELAPGWMSESSGFYYAYAGNFANIQWVRVAISDYSTSSGVEWHISLTDRIWFEYATPEYLALHPQE